MPTSEDSHETQAYVVRIYQRGRGSPDSLVGTVERVSSGETLLFRDLADLGAILMLPSAPGAPVMPEIGE